MYARGVAGRTSEMVFLADIGAARDSGDLSNGGEEMQIWAAVSEKYLFG